MASRQQDHRAQKISSAIDSLITHLIPENPYEDDHTAELRHDDYASAIKALLDQPSSSSYDADVNNASDLIKRKLIQGNPTQALRFSHLYTRLLSLPVLNQKWAILYFLYQLSDSPDPNEPLPLSPLAQQQQPHFDQQFQPQIQAQTPPPQLLRQPQQSAWAAEPRSPAYEEVQNEEVMEDAPSLEGSHNVPPERPRHGRDRGHTLTQSHQAGPASRDDNREVVHDPSEPALLRDLPFTLQGLSSATLPFLNDTTLKLPPTLPIPIISLLNTLAEPSLLYRGLNEFTKTPANGLLGQSLRAAISKELRSYLTLVATLETQIRRALSELDESAPRGGIGKTGVTLKRCVVWTREATMGLRLMSLIAEESKNKHGGQLITLIHSFSSSHGDPVVAAFAERLLVDVTRPFYDILRRWIYDGELLDPHMEFFVREQNPHDEERKDAKAKGQMSVWNSKYEIIDRMIPSIITENFSQKVFLIGKSLNFIRHNCGDHRWVEDYSKKASRELKYGDTATLEAWIDEAHKETMSHLMHLLNDQFRVFDHLEALKRYILLGQGDFIALLMESLAPNLDRPAGAQYRHTLTAQLEHAIRGSNAQYDDPEITNRLDARMLQLSHGDIGWDCFTLEYKIDAPVDVVVTEWGNRQYLKVFNFLWRIKRVEFALASTWRKCMTGARGVLQTSDGKVLQTWKSTRGVLAEMVHFVGQLQYYILFEVIESSWTELQKNIHKENCTLDDLITAHTKYLTSITHKGLLGAKRRQFPSSTADGSTAPSSTDDDRNSYMVQLSELLRTMLAYRDSVDGLYSWSVSDFTRRQGGLISSHHTRPTSTRDRADSQAASLADSMDLDPPYDSFDSTPGGEAGGVKSEFPALQDRLRQLGANFKTRLQILLGDLAYQPDVDMRFLGVSMNFNDVYQPVRRKGKSSTTAGAAASGGASGTGGQGQAGQGQAAKA
ncbi:Spc98 family-domain-containing protein [Sordaria brevicollis]|uniref:Spc98 family-domain-containing protein n=1 Tax=Sordaria brevicollis TaxID=83679 RepID=A0AAE0U5U4_SORBR|nr:Spc98 family-domain-containing protein [Sordaria brevicollis]